MSMPFAAPPPLSCATRSRKDAHISSTLIYAELALSEGRLRYACASHPPPLVTVPGGGTALCLGRPVYPP